MALKDGTLRLHYNAVAAWLPNIISSLICAKMSTGYRGIHNASCEIHTPCVFP